MLTKLKGYINKYSLFSDWAIIFGCLWLLYVGVIQNVLVLAPAFVKIFNSPLNDDLKFFIYAIGIHLAIISLAIWWVLIIIKRTYARLKER